MRVLTHVLCGALSSAVAIAVAHHLDKKSEEKIMGAVADALNNANQKVAKIKAEVVGKLADLQSQLDAKGALDAEDQRAIDLLNSGLDDFDNVIPDVAAGSDEDVDLDPVDTTPPVTEPEPPHDPPADDSGNPSTPDPVVTEPAPADPVTPAPVDEAPAETPVEPAPVDQDPAPDLPVPGETAEAIADGEPIADPTADVTEDPATGNSQ